MVSGGFLIRVTILLSRFFQRVIVISCKDEGMVLLSMSDPNSMENVN